MDEPQPASPRGSPGSPYGFLFLVVPSQLFDTSPQPHQFRIQAHATNFHVVTPDTESGGESVSISTILRFQRTEQGMQLLHTIRKSCISEEVYLIVSQSTVCINAVL